MRTFTFKGLFLTAVFMLLGCLSIQASDNDLITKQITIKLDEAGTLPNKIGSSRKYNITNLKIIGEINGTDLRMIREMAGRDYRGDVTDGNLSVLDLSEAKIVTGGDYYYQYEKYYSDDDYSIYESYTYNDEIGEYAFHDCSGLTSLTLPAGITSIGSHAFDGCSGLTSLNLPAGITSIGSSAFQGCSGLTSLTLPAGITSIGDFAFSGCSGLTSLTLPAGITSIGDFAFWGCSGLTSLTLPAGIVSIGKGAFLDCSGLTSLTLPDGITSIGDFAFQDCSGLTSLTLPAGITSIGSSAFWGCSGLKEVRFCINDNLDTYLTKGHPYIYVDCGIKYYINDKEITSIEIPSNVTTLGQYVFQECREFTSLTLPSSITEIGEGAFWGCSGLTSLTIPDGVTSISDYAFALCSGLTSLTIPSSVNSLGSYAFQECSSLRSIYVSWPTPIYAGDAFYNVYIKNCTLYVPQGTEQDYFLADVWGDFGNIVEYDPTGINKVTTSTDVEEVSRYSVNGQRLVGPTKGLNIVKYSDGSVKKVAVE